MTDAAQLSMVVPAGARCPIRHRTHCLTLDGRLWTYGPRTARCRGSRLRLPAARVAARTVRGIRTLYLPGDGPDRTEQT